MWNGGRKRVVVQRYYRLGVEKTWNGADDGSVFFRLDDVGSSLGEITLYCFETGHVFATSPEGLAAEFVRCDDEVCSVKGYSELLHAAAHALERILCETDSRSWPRHDKERVH